MYPTRRLTKIPAGQAKDADVDGFLCRLENPQQPQIRGLVMQKLAHFILGASRGGAVVVFARNS